MKTELIIIPDTNCWRGELPFLALLKQAKDKNICKVGCSYVIARECATADTIGQSCAALARVLEISNCWLRGRDEMMKGVASYLNHGWFDEITTEMLPYEAKRERDYWTRWLEGLSSQHLNTRKLKEEYQEKWVALGTGNRDEFLAQAKKFKVNIEKFNEQELEKWLLRCFDPNNTEWGGILLDDILEDRGLEKHRIHDLLRQMDQFPGLRLSYCNLLHHYISHIAGHKVDKSFVVDSMIFLPVSSKSIFVTRDKKMLKTAKILGMMDLVKTPEETGLKLSGDPRYNNQVVTEKQGAKFCGDFD